MQMPGRLERASFSALPDFACFSIEQNLGGGRSAPEHLNLSPFVVQHFPSLLAAASHPTKFGIVYKITIVTGKCQQHALFGCHSPLTEAVVVTSCTCSFGHALNPDHPGPSRSAGLCCYSHHS